MHCERIEELIILIKFQKKGTLQWYQSMVLEPIEFMYGIYELNKFINLCGDDMSRKVKQAFKLAHKTIHCEDLNHWLKEFIKNT